MRPLSAIAAQSPAGQRISKSTPLLSDQVHFFADLRIIGLPISAHRFRIDTNQDAGPTSGLSQQIFQHDIVQHNFCHQTLQLTVLVLKLLQALGIG